MDSYLIVPVLYILSMMRKKKRDQNTFLYANKTLVMNLLADDVARHSEDKSANSIAVY